MHIGSHVSTRGGYAEAARRALAIGATAFQYFPTNPRSLNTKVFSVRDAEACAEFGRANGLLSIGHAPYPLNLAADDGTGQAVLDALMNGLAIVDACGSVGLVVHFGKYKGRDPLQGYKRIIRNLNEALGRWHGTALVLLENQAGGGSAMGTTLEELTQIRSLCDYPDKIGFCLDTCHAFAAGLWNGADWAKVQGEGERLGYMAHLKAVHLNDSVYPAGSGHDRHANIGRGCIGDAGFRELLACAYLRDIPLILETGVGADGTHRGEIAYVRELLPALQG